MTWDQVQGNWKQLRGEALSRWGKLSGDEVDQVQGQRDRLVGLIQEKYGVAKDKADEQVDEFANSLDGYVDRAKRAFSDTAKNFQQHAEETKDYFKNTDVTEMGDDVQKLVSRYPMQSVLIGLGLGFLIGRGLSGRQ